MNWCARRLPAGYEAFLVVVHEFYGILDRDDVALALVIYLVHHRRKAGGLSASSRTSDEDQPAAELGYLLELPGETEIVDRRYVRGNRAHHRGGSAYLVVHVYAKASHPLQLIGEVEVAGGLEVANLVRVQHLVYQAAVHLGREKDVTLAKIYPPEVAVDPDERSRSAHHVKVGAIVFHHEPEQTVNFGQTRSPSYAPALAEALPCESCKRTISLFVAICIACLGSIRPCWRSSMM